MNERKHPEAGVFTGCILWPTDPVARCSAAVVPALQPAAASSCCSKPCYDAAVHNASMKRLAWQLLCFAPSTTDLPTKTSGDILTISISCRAAAWYLQFCSGRSCCRPQLQSAVSCFLQYSAATGSGGAAAENCIFYSATLVPAVTLSRYLGQRCEASSQVSVFPSTLWFTSTSPHDLEVLFSANIRFHYKAFVDFDSIYFLQNKSRRYTWIWILLMRIFAKTNLGHNQFLFSTFSIFLHAGCDVEVLRQFFSLFLLFL